MVPGDQQGASVPHRPDRGPAHPGDSALDAGLSGPWSAVLRPPRRGQLHKGLTGLIGQAGIEVIEGRGRLVDERTVAVETADGTREVTGSTVVLATGSFARRIRVPARLSRTQVDTWVGETLAMLREQWGQEWREDDDHESGDLLRAAALGRAEDKALDMLYWPLPRPFVVRVNVRVYPATPLTSWLDEGFEVDAFDTAEMGPAVRCLAQTETEFDGQPLTAVTAHFVFDDGTHQVQVEVEPTLVEMYSYVAFELVNLVASLEVRNVGTGAPFVPRPVPGYTLAAVDTFTGLDDGS